MMFRVNQCVKVAIYSNDIFKEILSALKEILNYKVKQTKRDEIGIFQLT